MWTFPPVPVRQGVMSLRTGVMHRAGFDLAEVRPGHG
jgi:hypothetical protein